MLEKFWDIRKNKPSGALKGLLHSVGIKNIPNTLPQTLEIVQKKFLRPTHTERWDLHEKWNYFFHKKTIFKNLQALGLVDPIKPLFKLYESLIILGSCTSDFIARLQYALTLDIHPKKLYLLSGKRPLTRSEYWILYRYKSRNLPHTEDEMMDYLFHFFAPKELSYEAVVSPMHTDTRPTTKDTIEDFLKTNPNKGHHLLISNQPFGYYQLLAANAVLKSHRHDITFDLAASALTNVKAPISASLDTVARILYEINELA